MKGQNYPVSGNLQVKPPYSVYLSDYTKIEEDKFILNVRLNDPVDPVRTVKLKIKLESQNVTIETRPDWQPVPLTLNSGFTDRFTGADLHEYFMVNNLQFTRGMTKQEFQRRGSIPEGHYKICVEVYDYVSGNKISLPLCSQGWIMLNDPPRLMLPENFKVVKANDPQNLVFRWLPMNSGSPNSFFTTEYEFSLYEIWPANRNPNDAVNTTPPILQEITFTPTYFYTIADPYLMPGRNYAWRVRARDANGLDLFKNQGYSEVFTFTWGVNCPIPMNIFSEEIASDRTRANWDEADNATAYTVRYRLKGSKGNWYEVNPTAVNALLTGTKPETEYEYQVRCNCGSISGDYSPLKFFTTPKASDYLERLDCNSQNRPPIITNTTPLATAAVGEEFGIGLFKVRLTEVYGSNGTFSGKGRVQVDLMNAEVLAVFSNVKVNTDRQVYEGNMHLTSIGASLIPPDVRDAIQERISEMDGYVQQFNRLVEQGMDIYQASQNAIQLAEEVIEQLSGGDVGLIAEAERYKQEMEAGIQAISNGDTTGGSNLFNNAVQGLQNLTGTGVLSAITGGTDKLKELVLKLLGEIKNERSASSSQKREETVKLREQKKNSAEAINERNKVTEIGDYEKVEMTEVFVIGEPLKVVLTPEEMAILREDEHYKRYFESSEKIQENIEIIIEAAVQVIAASEFMKEDKLQSLLSELKDTLKDDLLKIGKDALNETLNGKNPDLEKKIKDFLINKINILSADLMKE